MCQRQVSGKDDNVAPIPFLHVGTFLVNVSTMIGLEFSGKLLLLYKKELLAFLSPLVMLVFHVTYKIQHKNVNRDTPRTCSFFGVALFLDSLIGKKSHNICETEALQSAVSVTPLQRAEIAKLKQP